MDLARLTRVSFFQGMPQWALVRLTEAATEEQRPAGGMVLHQSDRAWAIHVAVVAEHGADDDLPHVGVPSLVGTSLLRSAEAPREACSRGRYPSGTEPNPLGPVSKSGWLLSWGDGPVRVMVADDQGCDLRSER
jgi:hypothetical protein